MTFVSRSVAVLFVYLVVLLAFANAQRLDWCSINSRWCRENVCLLATGSERRFCMAGCLLSARIQCATGHG
ncbi:hypothetical protein Ocin01_17294 [Orchesella cincta]|uniref:Uncharacterized protein n=1 Tax=Orchesella cincta TaxID=48709 RepID=A0A1D2M8S6_ORCCI|nr:hypothetical protein Ocin01_17294 [Orchesella cincta]